jgi:hypothetical protein
MTTTKTARGITNKQILCKKMKGEREKIGLKFFFLFFSLLVGLSSGHILAIPKSLLDPRRPPKTNVTQTDKEEG